MALDRASVEYSEFEFWGILLTDCSGDGLRTPGCLASDSVTRSQSRHLCIGVAGGADSGTAFSLALASSSALAEGENGD